MRKFSISDKLILAAVVLSVAIISIVASYSFLRARDAILSRSFDQLISVRVIKKNLLEDFFQNITKEVNLISSSSDIQHISNMLNRTSSNNTIISFNDTTNKFINAISKNNFNRIILLSNSGIAGILHNSNPGLYCGSTFFDSLAQTVPHTNYPVFKELIHCEKKPEHRILSCTHLKDGSGTIFFEINLNKIDSLMLEQGPAGGLGYSGESYLVGNDNLMRSSSRFQDSSVLITKVTTPAVYSALQGETGTEIVDDYRGTRVLSSYSKIDIPGLNWIILAEMDYNEVTIPVYRIRNEIVFISIFIFVMVLVVIFVLSRRLTYPIQRLNQAAKKLGQGNYNVEIKHKLNDEIGDLTNSFNRMVASLKDSNEELEKERVKSLRSLIDGQETERQRLSRELHDSLGQWLIGLKLKYESCIVNNNTSPEFVQLGLLFDKTIEETRRISNNLMPAALSEFGLITAVRNICNDISDTSGLIVNFYAEGTNTTLSQKDNIYIFRIIQEGLTNIIKHSKAKKASISLNFHENETQIKIKDNGKGFNPKKINKSDSSGLQHIYERVALLGGNVIINSDNKGTNINIRIPKK